MFEKGPLNSWNIYTFLIFFLINNLYGNCCNFHFYYPYTYRKSEHQQQVIFYVANNTFFNVTTLPFNI